MAKKKINLLKLKLIFNDAFMRETGLDIDDNDHIYDMEKEEVLQIKERFIKYCDYEFPILNHNEIDLNLIENARLTETLALKYFTDHINNKIVSLDQSLIPGSSDKGYFIMNYEKDGKVLSIRSDPFKNESVRVFNLICKINKTEHLYDFNEMDVVIEKK